MLSKFFVHRPVFASVISIVIVLLGYVSYTRLPVAQYPELAPPIVHVDAFYPGADAETIAKTVAAPLEQEVNGVDRMIYMASTSANGSYGLDVTFEPGTDIDLAAVLVQNRINAGLPKLPEEVRRQGVTTKKQSTSFVGVIALSSPDGTYDDLALANYLTINWRDEFSRIYGVGGVQIFPNKEYGMRIWLDPAKLKARNLSVNDVIVAVQTQNVQVAAGKIGQTPAPAGTEFELNITTTGRLNTPEEFSQIIVKAADRSIVRLKDIGRVELGAKDYSTLSTFNGKPTAVIVMFQLPGANVVEVSDKVRETLERLKPGLPPAIDARFFFDASMFIRASLLEVVFTLGEAFLLVFIVVLVFLQSMRTTIIPALTIPVSLVGTFLFMNALGFSINMLTMFGMILAIGIVVDDAIVVVENVERNMREHRLPAREATIRAMGEITGAIIAITLVLMSVFVPTAFLPGITGEMYRQFALTIAASTGLSAVCALTLSPALCAVFLKLHDEHHKPFILFRPFTWAANGFNRVFDAITSAYVFIARMVGRVALLAIVALGFVLFFTYTLYVRVPGGFIPGEDLGFVVVSTQLPDGASLQRTKAVIDRVSAEVGAVDGVSNVVALSGFSLIDGAASNVANCWIVLEGWDTRVKKGRTVEAVMADINAKVSQIQEGSFLVFSLPPINGLGNTSGFDMRVQDRGSAGRDALGMTLGELIGGAFARQDKILAAFSSYRAAVPQLFLDIDREKIYKLGIPLAQVFETLQATLGSAYVNDFNLAGRTFQVNMQADQQFRVRPEDILKLEVRTRSGAMVPMGSFVKVRDSMGANVVNRYNMFTAATLNGIPKPGVSSGEALAVMESLAAEKLPPGMSYEWTGMSFQEKQAGGGGMLAFALAILLVYLILAAQYESWTTPLAVVLSVPLVVIGAVVALTLRGLDNNVFTQIGLVLLVGLGAKNAILIVEFARENRARGMPILDSAVLAARIRFRPILMTSLAFILGVLPLTMAAGAGAGARRALGTAVFGGMVGVTILGLFFTPAIYVAVQWTAEKIFGQKQPLQHGDGHGARPAPAVVGEAT